MSLDLDITYILVLALFLVPVAALNGLVFRPFLKLFEERHERLEGAIQRAERMLTESASRAEAFEQKIQVATSKGIDARNKIRAEAQAEMNTRVDEARQRLTKSLDGALKDLEQSRSRAMQDVQAQAQQLADATARKLLGREL